MSDDSIRYRLRFEKEIQKRTLQAYRRTIVPGRLPRVRVPFWGIVRTPQGREKFAKLHIEKAGNRVLFLRVHDGKHGPKLSALFPGYLFVLVEARQWMHLRYSPGVIDVVKNGADIARVQDHIMDQLLREQGEDGYIELAPIRWKPKAGDTIKIQEGLFKDHLMRYIGLSPEDRIRALLSFMGKDTEVQLSRKQIGPAD